MIYIILLTSLYLTYYDLRYKKVPNKILLVLFILVLIDKILIGDLKWSLISGAIAFLTFFLVYIVSRGNIGMGDIKYTSITAIYFGYKFWLYSIIYCSISAIFITVILYLLKIIKRYTKIPFIPFLALGLIIQTSMI